MSAWELAAAATGTRLMRLLLVVVGLAVAACTNTGGRPGY